MGTLSMRVPFGLQISIVETVRITQSSVFEPERRQNPRITFSHFRISANYEDDSDRLDGSGSSKATVTRQAVLDRPEE